MFETYRMLGEQREAELLREAQRLQAGRAAKRQRVRRTPRRRLVSLFLGRVLVLLTSRPHPKARGAESAAPSQVEP
jgi:hypothetical protein